MWSAQQIFFYYWHLFVILKIWFDNKIISTTLVDIDIDWFDSSIFYHRFKKKINLKLEEKKN